ncbi:IS110 family transposase [Leifsonia sp. Le1]|uniref:IS110 family transposase n=1 Tax=Leifsonia sp. Le1 TaxID=3404918 RepID=UPI003EBD131C
MVGVDTHAAQHHYAAVNAATGEVHADQSFPVSSLGLAVAIHWATEFAPADRLLFAIEGAGNYGRQLALALLEKGIQACDVKPQLRKGSSANKSDRLDAITAALAVLRVDTAHLNRPKSPAQANVELQILIAARRDIERRSLSLRNSLNALVRRHDLGIVGGKTLRLSQIREFADIEPRNVLEAEATRLAREYLHQATNMRSIHKSLTEIIESLAPGLLDIFGVGPASAAVVLEAYSHHGRVRSEAAFAALAGTSPLLEASGIHSRHRLNPYGNRQLNRAINTVAISRTLTDPRTKDYIQRRTAEGLTPRNIRRMLRRYITRELYKYLRANLVEA